MKPKLVLLSLLLAVFIAGESSVLADVRASNYQAANATPELLIRIEDLQLTIAALGKGTDAPKIERPYALDRTTEILPRPDQNYVLTNIVAAKSTEGKIAINTTLLVGSTEAEARRIGGDTLEGTMNGLRSQGSDLSVVADRQRVIPGAEYFLVSSDGKAVGNVLRFARGKNVVVVVLAGYAFADSADLDALLSRKAGPLLEFEPRFSGPVVR